MLCQVESKRFLRTVNLGGSNILTNLSAGLTLPQWVPADHHKRTHPAEARLAVWEERPLADRGAWTDAQEKRDTRYMRTPEKRGRCTEAAGGHKSITVASAQTAAPPLWAPDAQSWEKTWPHVHCSPYDPHHTSLCHTVPRAKSPCAPISDPAGFSSSLSVRSLFFPPQSPHYPNAVGVSNLYVFAPTAPHLKWPSRPL